MHPRTVRRDGEALLAMIREAAATPEQDWPAALPEPLPLEVSGVLKKLRAVGQREAKALDIAPELMLRKTLEALLKSGYPDGPYQLPDSLRGWRRERMGRGPAGCSGKTLMKLICSIYKSPARTACTSTSTSAMRSSACRGLARRIRRAAAGIRAGAHPERQLAREDINKVLANIEAQGYHLQMPPAEDEYIEHLPEELLRMNDPM